MVGDARRAAGTQVRQAKDGVYRCYDNGLNPDKVREAAWAWAGATRGHGLTRQADSPLAGGQMSKGDNPKLARRDFLLLLLDSASEASEQDFRTVTCVVPKPAAIGRRDDLYALHKERSLTGEHVRLNTRAPELVDGQYHLDFEGDESRVQLPSPMNFVLQDETGVARLQVRARGWGERGVGTVVTGRL